MGINMTYAVFYDPFFFGTSNYYYAILYEINNTGFKPIRIVKINENPYGDVYFVISNPYMITNIKPIFILDYNPKPRYVYAYRLIKTEKYYVNEGDAKEFANLLADVLSRRNKQYIIEYLINLVRVYIVEGLSKEEALKILEKYESVVLWLLSEKI
jgi:hypothetical protein